MRLIIINGPCGVGKSTLGRNLNEAIPLSLRIDIDEQRRNFGQFREYREESWEKSFLLSYIMVEAYLKGEGDVIVDKMIWNINNNLDRLVSLGEDCGARVYEIMLWADLETVKKRAEDRGYKPEGLLTPEKVEEFWYEMKKLKEIRTNAIVIDTDSVTEFEVLQKVEEIISE